MNIGHVERRTLKLMNKRKPSNPGAPAEPPSSTPIGAVKRFSCVSQSGQPASFDMIEDPFGQWVTYADFFLALKTACAQLEIEKKRAPHAGSSSTTPKPSQAPIEYRFPKNSFVQIHPSAKDHFPRQVGMVGIVVGYGRNGSTVRLRWIGRGPTNIRSIHGEYLMVCECSKE